MINYRRLISWMMCLVRLIMAIIRKIVIIDSKGIMRNKNRGIIIRDREVVWQGVTMGCIVL